MKKYVALGLMLALAGGSCLRANGPVSTPGGFTETLGVQEELLTRKERLGAWKKKQTQKLKEKQQRLKQRLREWKEKRRQRKLGAEEAQKEAEIEAELEGVEQSLGEIWEQEMPEQTITIENVTPSLHARFGYYDPKGERKVIMIPPGQKRNVGTSSLIVEFHGSRPKPPARAR